jgi:hypothetical protein
VSVVAEVAVAVRAAGVADENPTTGNNSTTRRGLTQKRRRRVAHILRMQRVVALTGSRSCRELPAPCRQEGRGMLHSLARDPCAAGAGGVAAEVGAVAGVAMMSRWL